LNKIISERFAGYVQNNLHYWLAKSAALADDDIGVLALERQNIFRAVQIGLSHPPVAEIAVQVALQVFRLVELYGYWQEWIPILQQAVELSKKDTYQIKLLDQIGFLYRLTGDLEQAISIHEEAARQAKKSGEIGELARIYFNLGTDYREFRAYDEAERYAQLAGQAFTDSETTAPRNQAAIANLRGLIAHHQGDYETALAHYEAAIPLWQEAGATAYLVRSLLSKGLSLEKLGGYDTALTVYDQATKILDDAGLELDKVAVAINRGNIHFHLGQLPQAIAAYKSADSNALHRSGNLNLQAMINTNLGIVYQEMKDPNRAAAFLDKSIVLWRQVGDEVMLANALNSAADVLVMLWRISEARIYYKEALGLVEHYPNDAFAQEVFESCRQGLSAI
jgi:tetratricopeptide (TPR) repeat protein